MFHLKVKPEPPKVDRPADARPRRRLLGDGDRSGLLAVRQRVQRTQELDRLEVLAPAVLVRQPLPRLARVVQVQHRRDRVHAEAVDVVLLEPEEGVAQQEAADLVAPVVEDQRAPVQLLALARVLVLVERGAVEARQAVRILREVPGHPVEQHADARLVAGVHERPELVRLAQAARRREKADDLVAPRARERVLHHRQQLDVREAHLAHVRHQALGQLPVGQEPLAVRAARPRSEVHLVDRHRPIEPAVLPRALRHPRLVAPCVAADAPDDGRRPRGKLEAQRVGIRFREDDARLRSQLEFVLLAAPDTRDEDLPHPVRRQAAHRVDATVPPVEVADDADAIGIGCPHREVHPGDRSELDGVRAQLLVGAQLGALADQVEVEIAQDAAEAVGIVHLAHVAVLPRHAQAVGDGVVIARPAGDHGLEQIGPLAPREAHRPARHRRQQLDALRPRVEEPNGERRLAADPRLVRPEQRERIVAGALLERDDWISAAHWVVF